MKNISAVLTFLCVSLSVCPALKAMERTDLVLDRRGGQVRVLTEEGFEKAKRLQAFYDEQQKEKSVRFHKPPKEVSDEDLELARALSLSFVEPSESSEERALRLEEAAVEDAIRLSLSEISAQPIPLDDDLLREKNASPFQEPPKPTGNGGLGLSRSSPGPTPSREGEPKEDPRIAEATSLSLLEASAQPKFLLGEEDHPSYRFALLASNIEYEREQREAAQALREAEERELAEKKRKAEKRRCEARRFLDKEQEIREEQRNLLSSKLDEIRAERDRSLEEFLGDTSEGMEKHTRFDEKRRGFEVTAGALLDQMEALNPLNNQIHEEHIYLIRGGEPRYQAWMDGLSESFRFDYKRFLEGGDNQLPISPVPERASSPFLPSIPSSALPDPNSFFSSGEKDS